MFRPMNQNIQLALLILVIVIVYILSSRWRPEDEGGRRTRISFWIGLAVGLMIAVYLIVSRTHNG